MRACSTVFLIGIFVLAAAKPLSAQQSTTPVVGWLNPSPLSAGQGILDGFRRGLREGGFVDGKNVKIELHSSDGKRNRLPGLAADLVQRGVSVIMAGSPPAALAAQQATSSIPIVFTSGADPVRIGLVSSYARPGGNVTGFHIQYSQLVGKRFALLHELIPKIGRIALLINPDNPSDAKPSVREATEAARELAIDLKVFSARSATEIEKAFAAMVNWRAGGVLTMPDPFLASRRVQITTLAMRNSLPSSVLNRVIAEAGGLMSYGIDVVDMYRRAGVYAARILKGEKPANLPVQQPTKFEMVINLKTANALGITIPQSIMLSADKVIE